MPHEDVVKRNVLPSERAPAIPNSYHTHGIKQVAGGFVAVRVTLDRVTDDVLVVDTISDPGPQFVAVQILLNVSQRDVIGAV